MRLDRAFLLCLVFSFVSAQTCSRDTYTSLPPLPAFPTATYTGTVGAPSSYVQNHWSEKVTLPRPPNTITSTQSDCPHLQSDLVDWHATSTWGGQVPRNGSDVSIPANKKVLISSCSFPSSFVFGLITVPAGSTLILGDAQITLQATGIRVMSGGSLLIGSPTCRLRNNITITIHGQRGAQALPAAEWVKGIYVEGVIDVHGVEYFPTWTRLAATAKAGDRTIFIQDCPNWQPGQSVVVTTTEKKDSRDWNLNDPAIIEKVELTSISSSVCAVTLTKPLLYSHYGGSEYQAEVALLSRNILIQGDPFNSEPTDNSTVACKYGTSPSTYPCEDSFLTGFGVHVMVAFTATTGRFSGVEVYRGGQTNVLGRYPLHFHMLGTLNAPNLFWISDASVHRSYFRCYTIHGTSGSTLANGVVVTKSTGYDSIGHCFFASEDGVEENHTISYNLAAHVHPLGPYWQASEGVVLGSFQTGSQSFGSQVTATVTSNPKLVLADDIAGSPFYFTNAYSYIYGNAASGGWGGFTFPNLPTPKGFFADVKNFVPKNRPTLLFQGNSAHSTGFWQGHAAGVYLGGNLKVGTVKDQTIYTAGRFLPARDTCANATFGSAANTGGCPANLRRWNQFYDTKVFLANVGLQSWGDRSELVRFEVHDVQISTNVFGQVWIDQMLVNCRSRNVPTFLNGCTNPKQWWTCNPRDSSFFTGYTGFQFYDTGQTHMLTNVKFSNCQSAMSNTSCVNGKCNVQIWQYLTHSDQFTPGLMQLTKNVTYVNVDPNFVTVPSTSSKQVTVSGRAANWMDEDGTVTPYFPGKRVNIGSNWTGLDWWRYNNKCVSTQNNWVCELGPGDASASININWDPTRAAQIGSVYCSNGAVGGAYLPCPVGAKATHFGRSETNAYDVSLMPRVTGPIIASQGGWFVRFVNGTPNVVVISDIQVDHDDILHLAIPYPPNTKLEVYGQAPTWCTPGTQPWSSVCRHYYRKVNSEAEVHTSWGDAYYYNSTSQLLHLRVVALDSFGYRFASNSAYNASQVWNSTTTWSNYFSRGGVRLLVTGSSFWSIVINASSANCQPQCPPQPSVSVPPAMPIITPARCASLPSIPNSELGNCGVNAASGSTCTPKCNPGFNGTLSARCNAGTWSTSGTCLAVACTTLPTVANSIVGNCTVPTAFGATCNPVCAFSFSGSPVSLCNPDGSWTTTGSCASTTCSGLPTIPNSVQGDCQSGAQAGATCTPKCASGFAGTLSARCNAGTWTSTGTCTSLACTGVPNIANAGAGSCQPGASNGTVCTPTCNSGYTGTLSAKCNAGTWETSGACAVTGGSPCATLPNLANSLPGTCQAGANSGDFCVLGCQPGYQGAPPATCSNGQWVIMGSCALNTACGSTPVVANALPGNCSAGAADGTICAPVCNSGYSGTISAVCQNTAWSVTGVCTGNTCAGLPVLANSLPGNCSADAADGTWCLPTCATGFAGTPSASCSLGVWTTLGVCASTSGNPCAGLPTVANGAPGGCQPDSPSSYTCNPTCNSDFVGPVVATCSDGTWQVSGVCVSTSCPNTPSIPNAGSGNCTAGAKNGTVCTPQCNSGFSGTLSAWCNNQIWQTTGTCAISNSPSCKTPPTLPHAEPSSSCAGPNYPSGSTCSLTCKSGYTGAPKATCVQERWVFDGMCKPNKVWRVRVTVLVAAACAEVNNVILGKLNSWLIQQYNAKDVTLVLFVTSCQDSPKRQTGNSTNSAVVFEGDMFGTDAVNEAPLAQATVEAFFAQLGVGYQDVSVTVTEDDSGSSSGLSGGAIAGIVIGVLVVVALLVLVVVMYLSKPSDKIEMV